MQWVLTAGIIEDARAAVGDAERGRRHRSGAAERCAPFGVPSHCEIKRVLEWRHASQSTISPFRLIAWRIHATKQDSFRIPHAVLTAGPCWGSRWMGSMIATKGGWISGCPMNFPSRLGDVQSSLRTPPVCPCPFPCRRLSNSASHPESEHCFKRKTHISTGDRRASDVMLRLHIYIYIVYSGRNKSNPGNTNSIKSCSTLNFWGSGCLQWLV